MVIGLATSYILKYYILGWPGSGFIAGVVASYKGFVSRYAKIDPASGRSFPIWATLFTWLLVIIGFVALVVGLAVGNWFPDADQKTDLLVHRSIVTHGPLLLLVVVVASVMRKPHFAGSLWGWPSGSPST